MSLMNLVEFVKGREEEKWVKTPRVKTKNEKLLSAGPEPPPLMGVGVRGNAPRGKPFTNSKRCHQKTRGKKKGASKKKEWQVRGYRSNLGAIVP